MWVLRGLGSKGKKWGALGLGMTAVLLQATSVGQMGMVLCGWLGSPFGQELHVCEGVQI